MTDDPAQTTLGTEPEDAADTAKAAVDSGSASPSDRQPADSQVTVVGARGYDDWVAEREAATDPFAVRHVTVHLASDLSGTEYALHRHDEVRYPDDNDAHGQPTPRFGAGGITPDTVLATVRDWLLEILAYPYAPDLADGEIISYVRTIPATNCRVFVADRIDDVLRDAGYPAGANALQLAVNTLNSFPEHAPPPPEYRQTAAALNDIYDRIGHGASRGSLETRTRDIEQTIRARCGFTSRYGHEVPDPVAAFDTADLNTLHEQLADTRAKIERLDARADTLGDDLSAYRDQWRTRVCKQLDALLEPLQPDTDGVPEHVGLSERCAVCGRRYGGSLAEAAGPCDECMISPDPGTMSWTVTTSDDATPT